LIKNRFSKIYYVIFWKHKKHILYIYKNEIQLEEPDNKFINNKRKSTIKSNSLILYFEFECSDCSMISIILNFCYCWLEINMWKLTRNTVIAHYFYLDTEENILKTGNCGYKWKINRPINTVLLLWFFFS
jgi:hypothetical protein